MGWIIALPCSFDCPEPENDGVTLPSLDQQRILLIGWSLYKPGTLQLQSGMASMNYTPFGYLP